MMRTVRPGFVLPSWRAEDAAPEPRVWVGSLMVCLFLSRAGPVGPGVRRYD